MRIATAADLDGIVAAALRDAERRARLDPLLWPVAADAAPRIAAAVASSLNKPNGAFHWLVGEAGGAIAAFAHIAIIPPPPIYDLGGKPAGILLDDSAVIDEKDWDVLVAGAERFMAERGAVRAIAACEAANANKREALDARRYRAVTEYRVKHGLESGAPAGARPATSDDLSQICALGARARQMHCDANARMWTAHPDAEARFRMWMAHSLSLPDRTISVSPATGAISGFIVAQPAGPFQLPVTADGADIGLIDDFHVEAPGGSPAFWDSACAAALLAAAEDDFARRGKTCAMAICPAGRAGKLAVLQVAGYRPANLWLLKD